MAIVICTVYLVFTAKILDLQNVQYTCTCTCVSKPSLKFSGPVLFYVDGYTKVPQLSQDGTHSSKSTWSYMYM